MDNNTRITVALAKCAEYESSDLTATVRSLMNEIGCAPKRGDTVLVKPNLLAPTPPDFLPCTHPLVVRAICQCLLDYGAKVQVGDSPTFGDATGIAKKIGLTEALADLPVAIVNLTRPKIVKLSFGGRILISRVALENDMIVSASKLKAHHQVRVTGAVKNVYGCCWALAKPLQHLFYGDWGQRFETMMLEIWKHLPPSFSVMDAVTAMHVHGPTVGQPYFLGLLAASPSPIALDCAVMSILGLQPAAAPLWQRALDLNLSGSKLEDLTFPLEPPDAFDAAGFKTPDHLFPLSFRPLAVVVHVIKRFLADKGKSREKARSAGHV
jgi:uncharacterized protein (DUF362 family)